MTTENEEVRKIIREELASHLAPVQKSVDRIDRTLTGGHDPSRGLIVRFDRLEQSEANRAKLTNTAKSGIILAIISGVGAAVMSFFSFKQH